MGKSTRSDRSEKPVPSKPAKAPKPYPEFPMYAHASGRWAKKIRGATHFFGYWRGMPENGWRQALELFKFQVDDLQAGRKPRRPDEAEGLTVKRLCNEFMASRKYRLDVGQITGRTFADYLRTCERLADLLGRQRLVADLRPADFLTLLRQLSEGRQLVAVGNEVNRIRCVFKYAEDAGLIETKVRFGPDFKRPEPKTLDQHRQKKQRENGRRMLEAAELRKVLDAAGTPLRAFVLLGINAGFGQTDIAELPLSYIDLDSGWLDFPRPKTGAERRVPLWPEIVAAIRDALDARPEPADSADAHRAFLTAEGHPWVKLYEDGSPRDYLGETFARLLTRLKLKRPGVSFYALRHGCQTVAENCRDLSAVRAVMGHVDRSMSARYREARVSDDRLQAVTDTVRVWLWPDKSPTEARKARPRSTRRSR